ncbi:hypothetical protein D3C73_929620 [compost metagenome]
MLRHVFLGAHLERQLAFAIGVAHHGVLLARLHAKRNAHHGDPLLAFFAQDHHAPVLERDLGCNVGIAQSQNGNAARHGGIQLARNEALLGGRAAGQAHGQHGRRQAQPQNGAARVHVVYRHRFAGSMMLWSRRAMRVDRRASVLPCQVVVVSTASTPKLSSWINSNPLRTAFC